MNPTEELIQYRQKRARETLIDANQLFSMNSFNSCVNRIYYSVFYEVTALLLKMNLSSSKHTGVRALFQTNFVKTNTISKDLASFYSTILDFRQKSDYGDYVSFEKQKVQEWLEQARQFLDFVDKLLLSE